MKDPTLPNFIVNKDISIHLSLSQTQGSLVDQGYTYDQAGITYDQAGVFYGGLQNPNKIVVPTISFADPTTPHGMLLYDAGTTSSVTPNTNHSVGPGWLMFVTIP